MVKMEAWTREKATLCVSFEAQVTLVSLTTAADLGVRVTVYCKDYEISRAVRQERPKSCSWDKPVLILLLEFKEQRIAKMCNLTGIPETHLHKYVSKRLILELLSPLPLL